jgi:ATP-dependent helicase/nuclease subunit B
LPAVVLAGCDEVRLPVAPVATGPWTSPQRETLGLASPGALANAQRAAWHYALETPRLDLLWRNSEAGEPVLPNGYVQELRLQPEFLNAGFAADPRVPRRLACAPLNQAKVQAAALLVQRLSATAYNDLRQCPYRFFALRQLGLATAEELEGGLDKRDFGNWLHRVLFHFHTSDPVHISADAEQGMEIWVQKIDAAAAQATRELGLSEAEFLPFSASWPQVRKGYLQWLALPQNRFFSEGEIWQELQLGPVKLVGKLDRVDRSPDGALLLLDYKTEPQTTTRKRIKLGAEDTQLPFYAALFDVQTVQGAYLNVSEREGTVAFAQPELVALREQLAEGILDDMQRLMDGHWLVAMGQGSACDYCAARGLCRKDMVAQA